MAAKIVIKINDAFFLQEVTFTAPVNAGKLIIGNRFFSTKNKNRLLNLYPVLGSAGNITESILVFNKLIADVSGMAINGKVESLFSVIDATDVTNLMKLAKDRSAYVGENLLNYYFIEVNDNEVRQRLYELNKLKLVSASGIERVYLRGKLASFEPKEVISLPIDFIPIEIKPTIAGVIDPEILKNTTNLQQSNEINTEKKLLETVPNVNPATQTKNISTLPPLIIRRIETLFKNCGITIGTNLYSTESTKPTIKVVDIEQGWNFDNYIIKSVPSSSVPLLGHMINKDDKVHGQKTLSVLYGKESSPNPNTLNGLCIGADARIASTWYNTTSSGEYREAALAYVLGATSGTTKPLKKGDIVLLELQVLTTYNAFPVPTVPTGDFFKDSLLPVEIEPAMWSVIEAGVQAKYIIIEPAANGTKNLNIEPNYSNNTDLMNISDKIPGKGAIMVGAVKNDTITDMLNTGKRINYRCFGEEAITAAAIPHPTPANPYDERPFNSTSLASAITAALVANFQSMAMKKKSNGGINRRLTISEIKLLLDNIPSSPPPSDFRAYLYACNITSAPATLLP